MRRASDRRFRWSKALSRTWWQVKDSNLEGRHAVDTVDSVRGHPACDVDDALQRVVLRLREVSEGIIDGFHGRMLT